MCFATWVDIVTKLGTLGIGAIGAIYVFRKYKQAQRWKATDLAATLLERLRSDEALALACQALDWGVGPLIIPDRYRPLFPSGVSGQAPCVMQHDPKVLCLAVKCKLNEPTLHHPQGLVYRYCFIKLFDYLDNMFTLLADKQLREGDISEVKDWLEMLRDYKYAPPEIPGTKVFQPAMRKWGYGNVISLGQRLKVGPWLDASEQKV
jgi:hypothetical protein